MSRNKKNSPFTHTPVTGRFEHEGINFRVNVTAETNPCGRCHYKHKGPHCPQGDNHPACFSQERPDRESVYYSTK